MKTFYEAPAAEVIDFTARENLAYVPDGSENIGPKPEGGVGSKDF